MPISDARSQLESRLLDFLWNEWAQLGILAGVDRPSPWAQDLEALLILTFVIARSDARLFDEVLDWLARNDSLVSQRRLRTIARASGNDRLAAAAIAWVERARRKDDAHDHAWLAANASDLEPLHRSRFPVRHPDPAFADHGWLRSTVDPSHKSAEPDFRSPIAFGLRLRQLLGTGARAEVVRVLLTAQTPDLSAAAIARSAGYARRNVAEALGDLLRAEVIHLTAAGYDQRYGIDRGRWDALLDHRRAFPLHVDWIAMTRVLQRLVEWSVQEAHPSDIYLHGSRALDVLEQLDQDLNGLLALRPANRSSSQHASAELDAIADQLLELLGR